MVSKFTHSEKQIVGAFLALKLLVHFLTNTIYTFHRDEFLYLDEGNHLSWGYLEVPPLIPFLGKVVTSIFGDSVFSVRLLPALTGAIVLVLVARLVKELGGGKWALILACTAFLTSLAFLRTSTLFQPVGLDVLWWVLMALLTVLILKYNHRRDYYFLGLVIGLGWLTKYSIGFMVFALLAGVLLTPQRRQLSTKGLLIAAVVALCIALPNLYWQYAHNFPVVTHMRELASTQLVHVEPSGFLINQLLMHFSSALIWIPGVLWLLFAQQTKPYRYLGWTYILVVGIILFLHGKDYYTLGVYPVMMAGDARLLSRPDSRALRCADRSLPSLQAQRLHAGRNGRAAPHRDRRQHGELLLLGCGRLTRRVQLQRGAALDPQRAADSSARLWTGARSRTGVASRTAGAECHAPRPPERRSPRLAGAALRHRTHPLSD